MKTYTFNSEDYSRIPNTVTTDSGLLALPSSLSDADWQDLGGTITTTPDATPEEQASTEAQAWLLSEPTLAGDISQLLTALQTAGAYGLVLDLSTFPNWATVSAAFASAIADTSAIQSLLAQKTLAEGAWSNIVFHLGAADAYRLAPYMIAELS